MTEKKYLDDLGELESRMADLEALSEILILLVEVTNDATSAAETVLDTLGAPVLIAPPLGSLSYTAGQISTAVERVQELVKKLHFPAEARAAA